jgi:cytochrome c5
VVATAVAAPLLTSISKKEVARVPLSSRKTAWSTSITAAAAALAMAAATSDRSRAQEVGTSARNAERAEQILSSTCQSCHDRRRIDVQAKGLDAWGQTVNTMIGNGADLASEDVPLLVEHLAIYHGPMPDGPGKDVLLNTCTMCHDLQRIKLGRRSPEEWEETLVTMLNEGAPIDDREFALVHHYLSRFFGVD